MTSRDRHEADSKAGPVTILLIDDDVELCELLEEFLNQHGYNLDSANDGRQGWSRALQGEHDLILLDVMMPHIDGFELFRLIRRRSEIPVIMLTARTTQADRVAGLDAGADDYLPKPFGTAELLARIRAVLRRSGRMPAEAPVISAGGVKLIPSAREVIAAENASPGLRVSIVLPRKIPASVVYSGFQTNGTRANLQARSASE